MITVNRTAGIIGVGSEVNLKEKRDIIDSSCQKIGLCRLYMEMFVQ